VKQRTLNELISYQKELEQNKKTVEQIRSGNDHSKLKQWVRIHRSHFHGANLEKGPDNF